MSYNYLRLSIAAMLFCSVSIVVGAWTLKAIATVNTIQELKAEALCKADPTLCELK